MGHDDEVKDTDPTGRYIRFDDELGRGAYKVVYRAIDRDLGIEVAWNQIRVDQQADFDKLWKEITILQSLSHPNILVCHAAWVDEKQLHVAFITECMTSGTIRQFMKKAKSVKMKVLKNWCTQILAGLSYLHTRDPPIIHRDIKCDNILINGTSGVVKIGDLGLATNILNFTGTKLSVIGTPEFMAPEYYDEVYDEKVDIWAFGMCLLEMATLEYPFSECTNPAQIFKKVSTGQKPRSLWKIKDPDVLQFLEECLAPVEQRKSASQLLMHSFLQNIDDDNRTMDLRTDEEVEDMLQRGVISAPGATAFYQPLSPTQQPVNGRIPEPFNLNGGTTNNQVTASANASLNPASVVPPGASANNTSPSSPIGAGTPNVGSPQGVRYALGMIDQTSSPLVLSSPPSPSLMPSAPINIPGRREATTGHLDYTTGGRDPQTAQAEVSHASSMTSGDSVYGSDSPGMSLTSAHTVSGHHSLQAPLQPNDHYSPMVPNPATAGQISPSKMRQYHEHNQTAPLSSHNSSNIGGHNHGSSTATSPEQTSVTPRIQSPNHMMSSPSLNRSFSSQIGPTHLDNARGDMNITVMATPQSASDHMVVSLRLSLGRTIVEFDFRIDADTALDVAREMGQEFNLSDDVIPTIARFINEKVHEYITFVQPDFNIQRNPAYDSPLSTQRVDHPHSIPSPSPRHGSSPGRFLSNLNIDRHDVHNQLQQMNLNTQLNMNGVGQEQAQSLPIDYNHNLVDPSHLPPHTSLPSHHVQVPNHQTPEHMSGNSYLVQHQQGHNPQQQQQQQHNPQHNPQHNSQQQQQHLQPGSYHDSGPNPLDHNHIRQQYRMSAHGELDHHHLEAFDLSVPSPSRPKPSREPPKRSYSSTNAHEDMHTTYGAPRPLSATANTPIAATVLSNPNHSTTPLVSVTNHHMPSPMYDDPSQQTPVHPKGSFAPDFDYQWPIQQVKSLRQRSASAVPARRTTHITPAEMNVLMQTGGLGLSPGVGLGGRNSIEYQHNNAHHHHHQHSPEQLTASPRSHDSNDYRRSLQVDPRDLHFEGHVQDLKSGMDINSINFENALRDFEHFSSAFDNLAAQGHLALDLNSSVGTQSMESESHEESYDESDLESGDSVLPLGTPTSAPIGIGTAPSRYSSASAPSSPQISASVDRVMSTPFGDVVLPGMASPAFNPSFIGSPSTRNVSLSPSSGLPSGSQ